ncbi:hypothetical protein MGMO_93c00330 [Methyloglobulus morosus KoM1]|uniref:Uncharacterized protein n=1 Tax=Methyloglobulus morosus KoM1 TaxID=1116472 RepID=V5BEH7_9GAMM|nr:hypothetical protein [Methyloglobulus morosus]ESS71675.1 hypothetical protein MGMO_93c00330 [Methyloglobulus morosus KoM1]
MDNICTAFLNIGISDITSLLGVLGTIVTVIGFAFGCYFAVLAIDAYSHVKAIKNIKNDADNASKSAQDSLSSIITYEKRIKDDEVILNAIKCDICTEIDEIFSIHIGLFSDFNFANLDDISKFRKSLYRRRSLQALKNAKIIDSKLLNSRILEMYQYGIKDDIVILEELLSSNYLNEETRVILKQVKESILSNGDV